MFVKCGLTGAALVLLFASSASADVTFKYISAADAKAMVEAPKSGKGPGNIADGPDFRLTVSERNKPGKVEQHADWNDELIIQEGDVLLNYGGASENAKETGPGEMLGNSHQRGQKCSDACGRRGRYPGGHAAPDADPDTDDALYRVQDPKRSLSSPHRPRPAE